MSVLSPPHLLDSFPLALLHRLPSLLLGHCEASFFSTVCLTVPRLSSVQRLRGVQEPSALPIHPHQASRPLPTLGTQANRRKYTHSRRPPVTQAGSAQLPSLAALCPPRSLSTSCEEPLAVPKCASAMYASSSLRRLCALPQMLCSRPHVPDAGLQFPWTWGLVLFHPCGSRTYHIT